MSSKRKTGKKWYTKKCGRCGNAHSGYSGKLDKKGNEYVVCGITHKPMSVQSVNSFKDVAFLTDWREET